ncbi:hypothetical protein [Gordonia lacunae]|uniref:hypothetical protein n=1 Tax=Gordonia lacunae TaxID=417102 RepID=UPI001179F1A1|nr:hypothetical protein [Gordonia lacunae]
MDKTERDLLLRRVTVSVIGIRHRENFPNDSQFGFDRQMNDNCRDRSNADGIGLGAYGETCSDRYLYV